MPGARIIARYWVRSRLPDAYLVMPPVCYSARSGPSMRMCAIRPAPFINSIAPSL